MVVVFILRSVFYRILRVRTFSVVILDILISFFLREHSI